MDHDCARGTCRSQAGGAAQRSVQHGHYQERFDRIFAEPRYTDLAANLAYFSQLYTAILAKRQTSDSSAERAAFYLRYYDTIAGEKANVDARLARLAGGAG